ncbi:MAG: DUF6268 family outer membrane beta-barrel protein [Reichenbachiella sp.]|uniref:DUF6268 family outer membrane beta-barrel protein n=1 Tax=Reichenbachiella sp. TaxID=2184521 RepID=UPI00326458B5
MKQTLLIHSLLACFNFVQAQDLKLFEIGYAYYPESKIKEATAGQEIIYRELQATLKVPVVFNDKKTILINALSYGLVHPKATNTQLSSAEGRLHYIGYSLTAIQRLGEKWRLVATITPAISSNLKGSLSKDDFLLLSNLMVGKQVSQAFSWSAGLAYTTRFGEPIIIPIADFRYKKNNFKLNATVPYKIEALLSNKQNNLEYGLRFSIRGSQFNLDTTASNPIDVIRFSRMNFGPKFTYRVKDPISLFLFSGMSINRRHQLISDSIGDIDFGTENGFFINAGLFISPRQMK